MALKTSFSPGLLGIASHAVAIGLGYWGAVTLIGRSDSRDAVEKPRISKVDRDRSLTPRAEGEEILRRIEEMAMPAPVREGGETGVGTAMFIPRGEDPNAFAFELIEDLKVGREVTQQDILEVKETAGEAAWPGVALNLAVFWPLAKAEDLLRFTNSQGEVDMLMTFARTKGDEGTKWLMDRLASSDLDPEFRADISRSGQFRSMIQEGQHLGLDARVAAMAIFDPGKAPEQIVLELGISDVSGALNAGRDWRYAFRSGAVGIDEIYDAISAELPELAGKSPQAIRLQLYKELAEDNPAALAMLDGLPEKEKWETAIKSPRFMFGGVNPQDFYDFLQRIPEEASETVWTERLRAWDDKGRYNELRLGPSYIEWVENLPDGLDRDMAAYQLLKTAGKKDPALDARLRGSIRDPRVIEKMASIK